MRDRRQKVQVSEPCQTMTLSPLAPKPDASEVVFGGAFWYHPSDLRPAPQGPVRSRQVYTDQGFRIARNIME